MQNRMLFVATLFVSLTAASCSETTNCPADDLVCSIAVVSVAPNEVVLNAPAQTVALQVVALTASGDTINTDTLPRVWSSSHPNIASVNSNGLVTAIAVGSASITVSSPIFPDSSRSAAVTVDFSAVPTQIGIATQPGAATLGAALNPHRPLIDVVTP